MQKETRAQHGKRSKQRQADINVKSGVAIDNRCHARGSILCQQDVVASRRNSLMHF